MRRRWEFSPKRCEAKIIKPISGSTAGRAQQWCSIFGWEGPKRFLGHFEGILQSDGYAAYDHVGGPKIVHAACWAHARRKFFQAVELNPQDQRAIRIVAQMDELFEIDEKAREEALSREDRHTLRLEKSKALLGEIKIQIQAARSGALPKSVLAKACHYTLSRLSGQSYR